jgi:hypothetical protein
MPIGDITIYVNVELGLQLAWSLGHSTGIIDLCASHQSSNASLILLIMRGHQSYVIPFNYHGMLVG